MNFSNSRFRLARIDDSRFRWAILEEGRVVARFEGKGEAQSALKRQRRRLRVVNERQCGTCSVCCTTLGVVFPDSHKVPDVACRYLVPGVGCGIYDSRPRVCQEYHCGWRAGIGNDNQRPDRLGVLWSIVPMGERWGTLLGFATAVLAHELRPDAFAGAADVLEVIASVHVLVGILHSRRKILVLGPPEARQIIVETLGRLPSIDDLLEAPEGIGQ